MDPKGDQNFRTSARSACFGLMLIDKEILLSRLMTSNASVSPRISRKLRKMSKSTILRRSIAKRKTERQDGSHSDLENPDVSSFTLVS